MKNKLLLTLRIIAAIILLQTLFFKFTGAPESKFIFGSLDVALGTQQLIEPWGRIFSGVVELAASLLLLIPATQIFGALVGAAVMVGAILSHLFILGVVVQDDGGLLFTLACVVFISSIVIVLLQPDKYRPLVAKIISFKIKGDHGNK